MGTVLTDNPAERAAAKEAIAMSEEALARMRANAITADGAIAACKARAWGYWVQTFPLLARQARMSVSEWAEEITQEGVALWFAASAPADPLPDGTATYLAPHHPAFYVGQAAYYRRSRLDSRGYGDALDGPRVSLSAPAFTREGEDGDETMADTISLGQIILGRRPACRADLACGVHIEFGHDDECADCLAVVRATFTVGAAATTTKGTLRKSKAGRKLTFDPAEIVSLAADKSLTDRARAAAAGMTLDSYKSALKRLRTQAQAAVAA